MAAIFSLVGGMVGFASAVVSLVFLDASFAVALGIWSGAGLAVVVLGVGMTLITSDSAGNQPRQAPSRAYRN